MQNDPALAVEILYSNWKGQINWRNIQPTKIWYGPTEYHKEAQWLLEAIDLDEQDENNRIKNFALADVLQWGKWNLDKMAELEDSPWKRYAQSKSEFKRLAAYHNESPKLTGA